MKHRKSSCARSARIACATLSSIGLLAGVPQFAVAQSQSSNAPGCAGDNGGITLPAGFCATVFADNIGHARHLVVAPNGVVYVNTWSGLYYQNDEPPAGGFLVALHDTTGDGRADVIIDRKSVV